MNLIREVNSPLYQAWKWLENNLGSRSSANAKLAHLLVTFGGSYKPGNTEVLKIGGVQVSCTSGTFHLLNAWRAKARAKLEGGA